MAASIVSAPMNALILVTVPLLRFYALSARKLFALALTVCNVGAAIAVELVSLLMRGLQSSARIAVRLFLSEKVIFALNRARALLVGFSAPMPALIPTSAVYAIATGKAAIENGAALTGKPKPLLLVIVISTPASDVESKNLN